MGHLGVLLTTFNSHSFYVCLWRVCGVLGLRLQSYNSGRNRETCCIHEANTLMFWKEK